MRWGDPRPPTQFFLPAEGGAFDMTRISLPVIILNSFFLLCVVTLASAEDITAVSVSKRLVSVSDRAGAYVQARSARERSSAERRKAAEGRYSKLRQEKERLVAEIAALKKNISRLESAARSKKAAVTASKPKTQPAKKAAPKATVTAQKPQPIMKSGYNLGRSASLPHLRALKDAKKRGSAEKDENK